MTSPSEPLVSVVVPSVVTPPPGDVRLARCIESVLAQEHAHFELLLGVWPGAALPAEPRPEDDALAALAAGDARIRLIPTPQATSAVDHANQLLRHAAPSAQFFKWLPVGDRLAPRCLSDMLRCARENPSVALVGAYRQVGAAIQGTGLLPEQRVLAGREVGRLYLIEGINVFGSLAATLVRAEDVRTRQPFFLAERFYEQTEALLALLARNDFGFVHQILTVGGLNDDGDPAASVRSFDGNLLERLILLLRFGQDFLSPDELATHREATEARYYRHLARAVVDRRSDAYWDYHRRGLATVGLTIDRGRIAREMVPVLAERTSRPGDLLRGIARQLLPR